MANIYTGSDAGQEDSIVGEITLVDDGTASDPAIAWKSDTDTGFFLAGTGIIGFTTAGTERVRMGTTELTVNEGGNDVDFRVEGVGVPNALFVQGSNGSVGVGTNTPGANLHVLTTGTTSALLVESADDSNTAAPDIVFFRDSVSPAASDDLGHIQLQGRDSAANTTIYADMFAEILSPTNGSESGSISHRVAASTNSGSLITMLRLRGDTAPAVVINDEQRTDVDFRMETTGFNSFLFVDASADAMGVGGAPSGNYTLEVTGTCRVSSDIELDGALNHDGTTAGFFGTAPTTQQSIMGYNPSSTVGAPSADAFLVDSELAAISMSIDSIKIALDNLGLSA